jgi:hypothetical protein
MILYLDNTIPTSHTLDNTNLQCPKTIILLLHTK